MIFEFRKINFLNKNVHYSSSNAFRLNGLIAFYALSLINLGVKNHLSLLWSISSSNYSLVTTASKPNISIRTPVRSGFLSSSLFNIILIALFITSSWSDQMISISYTPVYVFLHSIAYSYVQIVANLTNFLNKPGNSLSLLLNEVEL